MSIVTVFLLLSVAALGLAHAILWFVENGNRAVSPGSKASLSIPRADRQQASGSAGLHAQGKGKALKSERVKILEAYLKTV